MASNNHVYQFVKLKRKNNVFPFINIYFKRVRAILIYITYMLIEICEIGLAVPYAEYPEYNR